TLAVTGASSDISGSVLTSVENITLASNLNATMTIAQNALVTTASGDNTLTLSDTGAVTGRSQIETYVLADAGGSTFTQVAGNTSVVSGSANDTIVTNATDATRDALTIDLTSGGTDIVLIQNTAIGNTGATTNQGLGARLIDWDGGGSPADSNATTLNGTIALWDGSAGTNYVTINGFGAGNAGDKITYLNGSTDVLVGGFADNVSLTTNNLSGLAVNSVIEIQSTFQINDGTNLGAVATMLDQLNGVQDGNYYVVIYDGTDPDSNAWIYAATATEGDGFDFADTNGATNGYDTDTVELIGFIDSIGADTLTSQNFI
ncbi:hypothetical protein MXB90_17100, partial [Phaeovulum sp. NW3]|nr:hypothetical protein [Phaeovulum sp. NW3]